AGEAGCEPFQQARVVPAVVVGKADTAPARGPDADVARGCQVGRTVAQVAYRDAEVARSLQMRQQAIVLVLVYRDHLEVGVGLRGKRLEQTIQFVRAADG